MNHRELLKSLYPCSEALDWYGNQDSYRAWRTCQRGDWMLWLVEELGIPMRTIVHAVCDCAELAQQFDDEEYPGRETLATVRRWLLGKADANEVIQAGIASRAYANYASGTAKAFGARAAAWAADRAVAHNLLVADSAAVSAATALAFRATGTFDKKCYLATLARCARIVRRHVHWRTIKRAIERLERKRGLE